MLLRSFKKSWFYLPLTLGFLLFASYVWYPGPVIVPGQMSGFFDYTEMSITALMAAFCCFVLLNKYEIELGLVCGVSTVKLFFSKVIPIFVYSLSPLYLVLALYEYVPYNGSIKPEIAIYVPENWKLYAGISIFVTFFFFFALFCFFRVLMRNPYVPIFLCLFFHSLFYSLTKNIQYGEADLMLSLVNPYMSAYLLSDTMCDKIATQHEQFALLMNGWTNNRIMFFAIGVMLLIITWLLLRKETLHKGFGD